MVTVRIKLASSEFYLNSPNYPNSLGMFQTKAVTSYVNSPLPVQITVHIVQSRWRFKYARLENQYCTCVTYFMQGLTPGNIYWKFM